LSIDHKAAALLHSIARNHALIDGNGRLALAAVLAFYGMNGRRVTLADAYDLVLSVACGELADVAAIAAVLERGTKQRTSACGPLAHDTRGVTRV